jgi:hypothetical protein
MENEKTQNLAERIAALLQENEKGSDDFLRSSIEEINQRLDRIVSNIALRKSTKSLSSINTQVPLHFSQEKFADLKEFADEIVNSMQNEKACPFEPAGKPCDNCAMCSSRGF